MCYTWLFSHLLYVEYDWLNLLLYMVIFCLFFLSGNYCLFRWGEVFNIVMENI
jgi:hypothetical protein